MADLFSYDYRAWYRAQKDAATRRAMQAALDAGEHIHLARIGSMEGVNCPKSCRRAGIKKWSGDV